MISAFLTLAATAAETRQNKKTAVAQVPETQESTFYINLEEIIHVASVTEVHCKHWCCWQNRTENGSAKQWKIQAGPRT